MGKAGCSWQGDFLRPAEKRGCHRSPDLVPASALAASEGRKPQSMWESLDIYLPNTLPDDQLRAEI